LLIFSDNRQLTTDNRKGGSLAQEIEAHSAELAESKEAQEKRVGLIYSLLAVVFFGTSAVLVVFANPVPPLEKTFARLIVASLFIFGLTRLTGEKLEFRRGSLPRFALYGFITAAHFAFYVSSLNFTSVAHNLTLIYTSPIFVAIFSAIFLKEKLTGRRWGGIAIATLGVAILAGFEPKITTDMLIGDGMAVLSAIALALYSIAGRRERNNYSLFTYAFGVYSSAMLWIFPLAFISFLTQGGTSNYGWGQGLTLLALGIVPLGLGHTLYNAGLRRLNATYVNIIATQEVTLGVIFAFIFLAQVPSISALIGGVVTLVGVLIVLI